MKISDGGVNIRVVRTLSKQFIDEVLATAFDGTYGGCWYWAKPAGRFWLTSEQREEPGMMDPAHSYYWTAAHIRTEEPTGVAFLDAKQEKGWFTVDRVCIGVGIQKILDGDPHCRVRDDLRDQVFRAVLDNEADIDSDATDCIVQIGLFGRLIFGWPR